ncbi:MAG: glycosyltransferase [Variovorax sp.]
MQFPRLSPPDPLPLFSVPLAPQQFRRFPRALRRWRLGVSNWRASKPYRRDPATPLLAEDQGCVVAVGDFGGKTGLCRAAHYEAARLQLRHPGLILLSLSPQPAGTPSASAFLGIVIMDIKACPERKNPWAHVEAWQKAFGDRADRVLLIKLRCSSATQVVERELREMIGAAGNIRLVQQDFSDAEQVAFQRMADVYLSLHRAEAYGLNIREFLEMGTPAVATHWSANTEYGPDFAHYHGVRAGLVRYRDWMGHYPDADFSWADADTDHAALLLREVAGRRAC